MSKISTIKISQLVPNDWNANKLSEEDAAALAERIKEKGEVDKPITARQLADGSYQIIDGEQTWRAAQIAGLADLPVILSKMDDAEAIATTFVKNLHGEMNPVILGRNIIRMQEIYAANGEELTNPKAAKLMNKSEGTVRNYLLYAEAAALVGSVPGWPDEAAIAALAVPALRTLLDKYRGGTFAAPAADGEPSGDGSTAADPAAEAERISKAVDRAVKSLSKLDTDSLKRIRRELGKLISAREAEAGEPASGQAA